MSFSKMAVVAGAAFISGVAAHGRVQGIVADGVWYEGYNPSFQYDQVAPVVAGWSDPSDLSNGFISPDAYGTSDIICHLSATNAKGYVNVTAGTEVNLQWTTWPSSHHGPVLDYLAACTGNDCTTVDKTTLKFFKIDGVGLIDDTTIPGTWASDQLIENNSSWSVTIPESLAPGGYVLRHEIIALHSAGQADGAQNYPQCVNLWVSGTGTTTPADSDTTLGTALYTETGAGISVDIYASIASYAVPGPTQWASATASVAQGTSGAVATGAAPVSSEASSVVASSASISSASTSAAVIASTSAQSQSQSTSTAIIASSSSSSKKSCTKKVSSTLAVSPVVTSAPVPTASSNVITMITDYVTVTDVVTVTVTA
ncbi:c61b552d-dd6d-4af0-b1da-487f2701b99b [Sclerotinia trifoliorum]|uniref:C61b552d-dd6d-4af0-b1da-487f2701b99b n=1 Tax=Sclerotinia trifoliorum TaxID=28548 RepID=A0A8H2ZQP3_9HELO|nr:c61b552d-dd6d-4af0-b1da-487f2701b99b [Sclerotinia trifoliorum]